MLIVRCLRLVLVAAAVVAFVFGCNWMAFICLAVAAEPLVTMVVKD